MSQKKREFWATRKDWKFLEFSPEDLAKKGVDAFIDILLRKLEKAGVFCQRRSEEEIWELIRRRALDGFTTAMRTFVGRCRKRNLGPHDNEALVAAHRASSTAEGLFLEIGVSIYVSYLQRLTTKNKEDFDGLVWRSVSLIRQGQTQFARDRGQEQGDVAALQFVMIDEFQDFSAMFFELVDAVRSVRLEVDDMWHDLKKSPDVRELAGLAPGMRESSEGGREQPSPPRGEPTSGRGSPQVA